MRVVDRNRYRLQGISAVARPDCGVCTPRRSGCGGPAEARRTNQDVPRRADAIACRALRCDRRAGADGRMFRRHTLNLLLIAYCLLVIDSITNSKEAVANRIPGGHRSRVTPVPIPNTEVKPATVDGTVWETAWESRSLPGVFSDKSPTWKRVGLLCLHL